MTYAAQLELRLGLMAVLRPTAVRPLQKLGFDLALEHDRPFEEACAMRDLDPDWVLDELLDAEVGFDQAKRDADWTIIRPSLQRQDAWEPAAFLAA